MSEITHAATLVRMDNMRSDVFADDDFGTQARRSSISAGGARRDRTDDLMLAKHALSQLSYGPVTRRRMLDWLAEPKLASTGPPSPIGLRRGSLARLRERRLVGLGRLELPTSRLSSARSNQLSYKPLTLSSTDRGLGACSRATGCKRQMQSHKRLAPGACSSAKK